MLYFPSSYKFLLTRSLVLSAIVAFVAPDVPVLQAAEWTIPIAGNSFHESQNLPGRGRSARLKPATLSGESDKLAIYFHLSKPAEIELSIRSSSKNSAKLLATFDENEFPVSLNADGTPAPIGKLKSTKAGYVCLELTSATSDLLKEIDLSELQVSSDEKDLSVNFVRNNEGNMFYWGRRGPSVHLSYTVPKDVRLQFGYTEIKVPTGRDVLGSYYMANGFGEGYFGFQVNSPRERRVLFSVWSPFNTDNPKDIPAEQRIEKLASGPDVHVGEFGNEGAGGQSYLVYPWEAGKTYRFLTEVKPDGPSHTIYTSWFGDKEKQEWRLIASFRRPKTNTYLRGFHSFLENFNPETGNLVRGAEYGNVWVRDVDGNWIECTQARLTTDATGTGKHRLDYNGGSDGNHFYMENCGFFNTTGKVGETFSRESTKGMVPKIDFDSLPKK